MRCPACSAEFPAQRVGGSNCHCPDCDAVFPWECSTTAIWQAGDTSRISHDEFGEAPPSPVARFQSLEKIGSGGFGDVYKAFDAKLQRHVALKVPHATRIQQGDGRERFVREARHLAKLRHPGILPIYDVSVERDRLLIVTEYLAGQTLSVVLRQGRLPCDQAASLGAEIAVSLHHAHQHGIVHRDVKPGNVMIDPGGKSYLMDFGLAKQQESDSMLSVEGNILGTPAYMSPEQAAGDLANVDRRSDIYSLGVVLYEMLTAERPFRGEAHLLLHQVVHDDPPRPRSLNDRIAHDLEMICLKAISKQPNERYDTALAFATDLENYLAHKPVNAASASPLTRVHLWCRRRERIREASTIAMAMFVMLALWELVSLTMLSLGMLPVENPVGSAVVVAFGLFTFSALAGIAYVARSRIRIALWFGFVASVVLLGFSLFCFSGLIKIDGLSTPAVRMPVFSFFSIAALFILVAHVISLTAYNANRDVIRWAKQS